jgi:hypothetical protein
MDNINLNLDYIKVLLIIFSSIAGIIGTTTDFKKVVNRKKVLTKSGKIAITIILASMALSTVLAINDIYQNIKKKEKEEKVALDQKIQEEERKKEQINTINKLSALGITLEKSLAVTDQIFQTTNIIKDFRFWVYYEINPISIEKVPYRQYNKDIWLANDLPIALKEIFENQTGLSFNYEGFLQLKNNQYKKTKDYSWSIDYTKDDAIKFSSLMRKEQYIPDILKEKSSTILLTIYVDRQNNFKSYKWNNPTISYFFINLIEYFKNGNIPSYERIENFDADKKSKEYFFPDIYYYFPLTKKIVFRTRYDYISRWQKRSDYVNFNLKDLLSSTLYMSEHVLPIRGPGIIPKELYLETKDYLSFFYKLKYMDTYKLNKNDTIKRYKLETTNVKTYK